jgi:O-methyltransferase
MGAVNLSSFLRSSTFIPLIVSHLRTLYLEAYRASELAVSKGEFKREFRRAGLELPSIHKGWFNDLSAADIPMPSAFAFLDGDFYDSVLASLRLVWPKMSPGGTVLIDDFSREALPGVDRAVHDYFRNRGLPDIRVQHDIAALTT